jgi:hypothetical protein
MEHNFRDEPHRRIEQERMGQADVNISRKPNEEVEGDRKEPEAESGARREKEPAALGCAQAEARADLKLLEEEGAYPKDRDDGQGRRDWPKEAREGSWVEQRTDDSEHADREEDRPSHVRPLSRTTSLAFGSGGHGTRTIFGSSASGKRRAPCQVMRAIT